jgi:carbonic anhydrase/acetyltransferase-like protein (isoleucine patch superfamily)
VATLIGNGGHAEDIAANTDYIIDRVVHHHDQYTFDGNWVLIGINDPHVRDDVRQKIGVWDRAWVHPNAVVERSMIGDGTHINYGVSMTRTKIGHHCTISPGVTICGDVVIGDRVLIGAGATICEKVKIEDDAVIGAGAVVQPGRFGEAGNVIFRVVPAGETWVGVPARPL